MLKKNLTRACSMLLCIIMIVTLVNAPPRVRAAYEDLNGHWSKANMEACVNRGILTGYPDNTMKPDNNISVAEAMTILSRLITVDNNTLRQINLVHGAQAAEIIPSSGPVWARSALEICLAAGVVLDSEVRGNDFNKPLKKQGFALFLFRTLMSEESTVNWETTIRYFSDYDTISTYFAPSIAKLKEIGILEGDEQQRLLPESPVTRAVAATMLNKAILWRENKYGSMPVFSYTAQSPNVSPTPTPAAVTVEGLITKLDNSELVLRQLNGLQRVFEIPLYLNIAFTDAAHKPLSYTGYYAVLELDKDNEILSVTVDNQTSWVQGTLDQLNTYTQSQNVLITESETGEQVTYKVTTNAAVSIQDKSGYKYADLARLIGAGRYVTMRLAANREVLEIKLLNSVFEFNGTVTGISFDTVGSVDFVTTDAAYRLCFRLDTLPRVFRDNTEMRIDALRAGYTGVAYIVAGSLTTLRLNGQSSTVSGVITAVSRSVDGDTITVKLAKGDEFTYIVERGTIITMSRSILKINDLAVGDEVNMLLYGETVTEIVVTGRSQTTEKIAGKLILIDYTKSEIVVQSNNTLYTISVGSGVTIISSGGGKNLSFNNLSLGQSLTVFGTLGTGSIIVASSIVIER